MRHTFSSTQPSVPHLNFVDFVFDLLHPVSLFFEMGRAPVLLAKLICENRVVRISGAFRMRQQPRKPLIHLVPMFQSHAHSVHRQPPPFGNIISRLIFLITIVQRILNSMSATQSYPNPKKRRSESSGRKDTKLADQRQVNDSELRSLLLFPSITARVLCFREYYLLQYFLVLTGILHDSSEASSGGEHNRVDSLHSGLDDNSGSDGSSSDSGEDSGNCSDGEGDECASDSPSAHDAPGTNVSSMSTTAEGGQASTPVDNEPGNRVSTQCDVMPQQQQTLIATTQSEFSVDAPPTRRGRIRKTRDMGELTVCICGSTVSAADRTATSTVALQCGYLGCEVGWVSLFSYQHTYNESVMLT